MKLSPDTVNIIIIIILEADDLSFFKLRKANFCIGQFSKYYSIKLQS
ncbi:MAG: hypothetical protein A8274_156 [Halanaerobium sp. 4-GBenrich]|jgi:hypothetical protein|nr:MAG: hypothetical protein AWL62_316 [Halanaerobium sp. T82-1]ODS50877.1 MAG: hypothetical protein A8274_156 [Halanaerobium sp. 4-GBenrich]PUU90680.1 MAG: hypothetical protein CI948_1450 [Halanaerobium sp.]